MLRTPVWARFPSVGSLGSVVPILAEAIDPVIGFLTRVAVMAAMLLTIDRITRSWTERRVAGVIALGVVGFLSAGVPSSGQAVGWALAGALLAGALVLSYVTLLRFDITLVPIAIGTMMAVALVAPRLAAAVPGSSAGVDPGRGSGRAAGILVAQSVKIRALDGSRQFAVGSSQRSQ